MKTTLIFVAVCVLMAVAATAAPERAIEIQDKGCAVGKWTTDLDAATAWAKTENLPVLLSFTGSDWCSICHFLEKEVFATQVWKDYAAGKLLLVNIDVPRDRTLIPPDRMARNERLSTEYEIEGMPTVIMLDADGTTVLGRVNVTEQTNPYNFIADVGDQLRFRKSEMERVTSRLSKEDAAEYRKQAERFKALMQEFQEWIGGQPLRNEENARIFADYRTRLTGLLIDVEHVEARSILENLQGKQADATVQQLAEASTLEEKLADVSSARARLEQWLRGRPAKTEESERQLQSLTKDFREALDAVREARR